METKPISAPGPTKPHAVNPVMDVVSPPAIQPEPKSEPEIDPLDKLAADDKAEQSASQKTDKKPDPKAAKPKRSDQPPGITLAIVATVVIVLGLAAIATYAYLQSTK